MGVGDGEKLFIGEGAGLGGDELGVISRRGAEVDVALRVFELSLPRLWSRESEAFSSRYTAGV